MGTLRTILFAFTASALLAMISRADSAPDAFDLRIAETKAAMMGDPARALALAQSAEALAGGSSDRLAATSWLQAEALTRINRPAEARPLIDRGFVFAGKDGKITKIDGDLRMSMARVATLMSNPELALKSFQTAHDIFANLGERRSQAISLQGLGAIYGDARDYAHALTYYTRAGEAFRGDAALDLAGANNVANTLKDMGRLDEALTGFERALAFARIMKSPQIEARIVTNIAAVQSKLGDLAAGDKSADRAIRLLKSGDEAEWARFAWGIKAEISLRRGDLKRASSQLARAFQRIDPSTTPAPFRDIHEIAYKVFRSLGRHVEALSHHEAFKRLDDASREISASSNLALSGARFDFATQELELNKLKTRQLERDVKLTRTTSALRLIVLGSALLFALLAAAWAGWRYISVHRHRNEIAAANGKLRDTVDDLNSEVARRKATESRLREARDAAEQANRAKTQFLANMSHELRTPLNAIIGFADIIAGEVMGPVGTRAYKGYAGDILTGGRQLLAVVSDVLEMSRLEAGTTALEETSFELCRKVENALTPFREDPANARRSITFAPSCPGLVVRADERMFEQMVQHLLSNAVKFTGETGAVRVSLDAPPGAGVVLTVADDGIGIASDKMALILETFGQVEDAFAKSNGGAGLGLPIVKALATLHGGLLELESQPGQGTVVRLRLPPSRLVQAPENSKLSLAS